MKNLVDANAKILPIKAILKALETNEEKLLSYQDKTGTKPDKIKGKLYYSLDDLEKLKQAINSNNP